MKVSKGKSTKENTTTTKIIIRKLKEKSLLKISYSKMKLSKRGKGNKKKIILKKSLFKKYYDKIKATRGEKTQKEK